MSKGFYRFIRVFNTLIQHINIIFKPYRNIPAIDFIIPAEMISGLILTNASYLCRKRNFDGFAKSSKSDFISDEDGDTPL